MQKKERKNSGENTFFNNSTVSYPPERALCSARYISTTIYAGTCRRLLFVILLSSNTFSRDKFWISCYFLKERENPSALYFFCHFTTWLPFLIFTRKTANCFYNQKPFSSLLPQLFKSDALFLTETAEKKKRYSFGKCKQTEVQKKSINLVHLLYTYKTPPPLRPQLPVQSFRLHTVCFPLECNFFSKSFIWEYLFIHKYLEVSVRNCL